MQAQDVPLRNTPNKSTELTPCSAENHSSRRTLFFSHGTQIFVRVGFEINLILVFLIIAFSHRQVKRHFIPVSMFILPPTLLENNTRAYFLNND
jgi:hypothetical protein